MENLLNDGGLAGEFIDDLIAVANTRECGEQGRGELRARRRERTKGVSSDRRQPRIAPVVKFFENEDQGRIRKRVRGEAEEHFGSELRDVVRPTALITRMVISK